MPGALQGECDVTVTLYGTQQLTPSLLSHSWLHPPPPIVDLLHVVARDETTTIPTAMKHNTDLFSPSTRQNMWNIDVVGVPTYFIETRKTGHPLL